MYRFSITGVVQGVGFRPFIAQACTAAGLRGFVQNTGTCVVVVVDDKERFLAILQRLPPLARIDTLKIEEVEGRYDDFSIKESEGKGFAEIPPDLFLCPDCRKELTDPANRRHGYYFLTCTNCGPRFSITRRSPYDRATTTMAGFEMCAACAREYASPANRRYHAQTIACHDCGPRLSLIVDGQQRVCSEAESITIAARMIKSGAIVAIKGVGGFHLACRPTPEAVAKLRRLTGRREKPFAIMCRDITMVQQRARVTKQEEELLLSVERPIVILKKQDNREESGKEESGKKREVEKSGKEEESSTGEADEQDDSLRAVSELDSVGIMLPYTALHYLLLDALGEPVVMTSSNLSDAPITTTEGEQAANIILTHERRIENPVDDSLMKIVAGRPLLLRRSRGFVPRSLPVKGPQRQLLALGAEQENTFCVLKDGKAFLSQYMGTTSNSDAFKRYKKMIRKFLRFTDCTPEAVVVDAHPGYNTSRYGAELAAELGLPLIRVQHHEAHAAAVAMEHGLEEPVSIVCDGLGYGKDGTIWGGEVFSVRDGAFERVGHLEEQLQLGGDSATIFPDKMLYAILSRFLSHKECKRYVTGFTDEELGILRSQLKQRLNCPVTTSCGRILDAAAALLDLCHERSYEGRPAMLLDAHATRAYDLEPVIEGNVLMTTPLFRFLVENREKESSRLAATVQTYLARGLHAIAAAFGKPITFSGGCAYNRSMTAYMVKQGVFVNEQVPCGDGGISFGQVAHVVRHGLSCGTSWR